MKRKYINPCSEEVRLNLEQSILAGSLTINRDEQSFDAGSSYTNEESDFEDDSYWE